MCVLSVGSNKRSFSHWWLWIAESLYVIEFMTLYLLTVINTDNVNIEKETVSGRWRNLKFGHFYPAEGTWSLPGTLYCSWLEFVQASNYFLYFPSAAKAETLKRSYRCKYRHSKCQWMLLSYDARTSSIYQCCWLDQMAGWWDTLCHPLYVGMTSQWTHSCLQNENGVD